MASFISVGYYDCKLSVHNGTNFSTVRALSCASMYIETSPISTILRSKKLHFVCDSRSRVTAVKLSNNFDNVKIHINYVISTGIYQVIRVLCSFFRPSGIVAELSMVRVSKCPVVEQCEVKLQLLLLVRPRPRPCPVSVGKLASVSSGAC